MRLKNTIPKWYKNSYRRNLVDMHISACNPEFLAEFDPQEYFQCLKTARIQSPMIYTHSHVGYCNWASESGEMHPGFHGKDKIGELIDLCNADKMDVIAYYSLIYNNWVYDKYPQWRMLDVDGNPSRSEVYMNMEDKDALMMSGLGRYGLICPNSYGYRDFLKQQFSELCSVYSFKGLFLDMTFWPMICYCDNCRNRYREETGLELPETIDWTDPDWIRFQEAREIWLSEFAAFASGELKRIKPDIDIEHQFSTATHPWTFGVRAAISENSDYTGGDLYGGFEQQSFICKLYYGITKNQPFEYMTSRCDPSLFDHTTTKSVEMLKLHAYLTYAHHGAFLAIDAIDPRGTLNRNFYETLGNVFSETSIFEKYYSGFMKSDIAIYFSLASKMDIENGSPKRAKIIGTQKYPHIESSLGAATAFRKMHIPYSVVTDNNIAKISSYDLIVLSNAAVLQDEEAAAILNFVRCGGKLYISGTASEKLCRELMGISFEGVTREEVTYMSPTDAGQEYFGKMYDRNSPMTVFGSQHVIRNHDGNQVLATITLPYTDPADLSVFASIHSNPPGIYTQNPAIILASYGKGKVIWASAAFEESNQFEHKKVFVSLIQMLLDKPMLVTSSAPTQVEFTVFLDEDKSVMQIHCVNIQEQFPMIPMNCYEAAVRTDKTVTSVKCLPEQKEIEFTQDGTYVSFAVDSLDIFRMFEVKYNV